MKNATLIIGILLVGTVLFGCTSISNYNGQMAVKGMQVACPELVNTTYVYGGNFYPQGVMDFKFKDNWTISGAEYVNSVICSSASNIGQNINYSYCHGSLGDIVLSRTNLDSNGTILSQESLAMSFAIEKTNITDVKTSPAPLGPQSIPILYRVVEMNCSVQ
jgi:hypothetical protein